MGQLVPSVLLHGQALKLLEELNDNYTAGMLRNVDDLIQQLAAILTRFEENAGKPFLKYEPVAETEPPSSEKTNRMWRETEKDLNLMQQQLDILRASTVFSHNLVATEVMSARQNNLRVNNKLKTLQLYSDSVDSKIITFGDSFRNLEFVATDLIAEEDLPTLMGEGYVTLGHYGTALNLAPSAQIKILDASNGFLGNNHEIEDPTLAPRDADSGATYYTFKAENRVYNDLDSIVDEEPNTWIEYESYSLTDEQKRSASNLNFVYARVRTDGTTEHVNWASGPPGGVLKFHMTLDLGSIKPVNAVEFMPYGLENNANYPVLVRNVHTSPNGTDWTRVYPPGVWIGTETNLRAARTASDVVTGKAIWAFEARSIRYVRFEIEQPQPVNVRVGHAYYVDQKNEAKREMGPVPPASEPTRYYDEFTHGTLLQRREYFDGKRWAIGIRDIAIRQIQYGTLSVLVSKPLRVGGIVDRVVLDHADIFVPPEYPSDEVWIRFFVSPDDGNSWYQISRIQDDFLSIPEQIAFNDPTPEAFREPGVAYYNVDVPVTTLRFKVEMSRPGELDTTTPILRSYTLKVRRR